MTVEYCAALLRGELTMQGFPGWTSYRSLLGLFTGCLEVQEADICRPYLRMRSELDAVIKLPAGVRSRERETMLWEELGHYICFRYQLAGQMPAGRGARTARLGLHCDGVDERQAERWVRAFLLPHELVAEHSSDLEYIAEESGCSLEMIQARYQDLRR